MLTDPHDNVMNAEPVRVTRQAKESPAHQVRGFAMRQSQDQTCVMNFVTR